MEYHWKNMVDANATLCARARLVSQGIIEIKCVGRLRREDTAYLSDLAPLITKQNGRVCLVFEALDIEGYSPDFPMAHIDFFKHHRKQLHRIAVVHLLKSIAFAIATVSLASNTNIKGFSTLSEAIAWLRSNT